MVKAEHLVKVFTKTEIENKKKNKVSFRAVNDISIEAYDGETLGVLGPNGAGKTTLLRMLGTLMEPTEGKVTHIMGGEEITKPERVKARMGYLSNNTKLYDKFSVREFLELLGDIYGFDEEKTKERIEEVVKTLKLDEFIDSRIASLSTGQTQRVSIARCLFPDPDLYILDEPTLGLDIMSAAAIVDFMIEQKKKGKTIIYSTHYLEEAQSLCDRVVLIGHGQVLDIDTPANLCEKTGKTNLREAFLAIIEKEEQHETK